MELIQKIIFLSFFFHGFPNWVQLLESFFFLMGVLDTFLCKVHILEVSGSF